MRPERQYAPLYPPALVRRLPQPARGAGRSHPLRHGRGGGGSGCGPRRARGGADRPRAPCPTAPPWRCVMQRCIRTGCGRWCCTATVPPGGPAAAAATLRPRPVALGLIVRDCAAAPACQSGLSGTGPGIVTASAPARSTLPRGLPREAAQPDVRAGPRRPDSADPPSRRRRRSRALLRRNPARPGRPNWPTASTSASPARRAWRAWTIGRRPKPPCARRSAITGCSYSARPAGTGRPLPRRPAFFAPPAPAMPVLLVSGERDPVAPPDWAEAHRAALAPCPPSSSCPAAAMSSTGWRASTPASTR